MRDLISGEVVGSQRPTRQVIDTLGAARTLRRCGAAEIRDEVVRLLNAGRKVPITVPMPVHLTLPSKAFADHEAN